MIKVGIFGYGKMGKMLQDCSKNFSNLEICSIFSSEKGLNFTQNLGDFFNNSDVIIDFSSPKGTKELLNYAINNPKILIIGTTGLDDDTLNLMQKCAKSMPVLYASNFSLGIAVLNRISCICAKILSSFDCEIVETHHNQKADTPSGTALSLAKSIADAKGLDFKKYLITNRDHKREANEISIQSLRGGDVAGIHSVNFFGLSEYIELKHTAKDRQIFANGALRCVEFMSRQKTGLYSIEDCLGI